MQTAVMMKRVAPLLLLLLLKVSSTSCFQGRLLLQYQGSNGSDQSPAAAGPGMANPSGNPNPVNITQIIQAVRTAEHEPEPHMITLSSEVNVGGSTISVGESYAADTLTVQVRVVCDLLLNSNSSAFMQMTIMQMTVMVGRS